MSLGSDNVRGMAHVIIVKLDGKQGGDSKMKRGYFCYASENDTFI